MIGLAQTGSGKTGAFVLPILQGLLDAPSAFYALILSPTRELAIQISEQVEALGAGTGVRTGVLVGGVDATSQAVVLGRRPHVLVGSPGRVVDHLTNTKGFSLRTLKHLVLDEADRLLNMDFEKELDAILAACPRERRTQLFSATMTSKVARLQRACLRNPAKVEVAPKNSVVATLRQEYAFVPAKLKDAHLIGIMTQLAGSTAIIFARTCDSVRRVALALRALGFSGVPIHGQMTQPKRLAALAKFKAGERSILVATDVASRGLDIPSVDLVINYDVPGNGKDYVHRVGRTARAGRSGRAVTLVTQYDVEAYQKVEALIGKKLDAYPVDTDAVELLAERVADALRIAAAQMRETDERRGGKRGKHGPRDDEDLGGSSKGGKRRRA